MTRGAWRVMYDAWRMMRCNRAEARRMQIAPLVGAVRAGLILIRCFVPKAHRWRGARETLELARRMRTMNTMNTMNTRECKARCSPR